MHGPDLNIDRKTNTSSSLARRGRVPALMVAALLGVALVSAACSSSPSSSTTTSSSKASTGGSTSGEAITIQNFTFSPASLSVKPGATITVTNKDNVAHTVTSTDNKFSTGNVNPNQTKTFTAPTTPGTYKYMCSIHPYMTGTLVVT